MKVDIGVPGDNYHESVVIEDHDVWNADHTLALIIHPTLLKLKEVQHGYPHVDNEDVPEELRFSEEDKQKLEYDGTVDDKHSSRWDYVLDEMIWAFEQCTKYDKGANIFVHNPDQLDMKFIRKENSDLSELKFSYQKDPTKPKYWVDREGEKLHYDRISNGLRLFAKYYFSLWD